MQKPTDKRRRRRSQLQCSLLQECSRVVLMGHGNWIISSEQGVGKNEEVVEEDNKEEEGKRRRRKRKRTRNRKRRWRRKRRKRKRRRRKRLQLPCGNAAELYSCAKRIVQ